MSTGWLEQYLGNGKKETLRERGGQRTPKLSATAADDDKQPWKYLASPELRAAVNVAIALGQPLLLTGDPGTGKSQLAASLAWDLELPLFPFVAKTTSTARDLLYRYEALRHFHASRFDENITGDAGPYIEVEALGKAILLTRPAKNVPDRIDLFLPKEFRHATPQQSVVLIDEIDKAPLDFPNDLLDEVDRKRFRIAETGDEFEARREFEPIVVLTSNSEKSLPDAFLRRCVFHHILRPNHESLIRIIESHFGEDVVFAQSRDNAVQWFVQVRDSGDLQKAPSTAECLQWIRLLEHESINLAAVEQAKKDILRTSCSVLAKTVEDLKHLQSEIEKKVVKG